MKNAPARKRRHRRAKVGRLLIKSLLRLLASPILFLVYLVSRRRRSQHEVVFYTYPKLLFAWPLVAAGFLLAPLSGTSLASPAALGWIYGMLVVLTIVTMGIDINRNTAAFWLVVIICCWFAVLWLRDVKGLVIFSHIYQFFRALDVTYQRDAGLLVSIWLSVVYVLMLAWSRVNSMWRVTHNEFEHYSLGRADDSLGRGAKRIRTEYPDLFEVLVCLAGDLIIFDSSGKRILRRIPNIPFLPFKHRRIDQILQVTLVTTEATPAQLEEEEVEALDEADTYDLGETDSELDAHERGDR